MAAESFKVTEVFELCVGVSESFNGGGALAAFLKDGWKSPLALCHLPQEHHSQLAL